MSAHPRQLMNCEFELNQLVFAQMRRSSTSPPWPSRIVEKKGFYYIVRFLGDGRTS